MEHILLISSIALWLVVALNLMLTLALVQRQRTRTVAQPKLLPVGEEAPPFEAETAAGDKVTLDAFDKENELAMVFVSPKCTACITMIPFLNNLRPLAERAGVTLVLVSDSSPNATQTLIAEHGVALPVLSAPRKTNDFLDAYRRMATPIFCLLDRKRKVKATGFLDGEWHELTAQWIAA
jgi:peroxiredoxin